jgi:hypothetical protein
MTGHTFGQVSAQQRRVFKFNRRVLDGKAGAAWQTKEEGSSSIRTPRKRPIVPLIVPPTIPPTFVLDELLGGGVWFPYYQNVRMSNSRLALVLGQLPIPSSIYNQQSLKNNTAMPPTPVEARFDAPIPRNLIVRPT